MTVEAQEIMKSRKTMKWRGALMVFPSEEPPFIDGVVFDPAPAIIQALKWKHQSIEKLAIK